MGPKADFAGSGPLVWVGKPALAAGIVALLLGRDVHAMQTKAGIERAVAGFLEEGLKAPANAAAWPEIGPTAHTRTSRCRQSCRTNASCCVWSGELGNPQAPHMRGRLGLCHQAITQPSPWKLFPLWLACTCREASRARRALSGPVCGLE